MRLISPSFISSFRLPLLLPSRAATELPLPRSWTSPFISPRVFCIISTFGISAFSFRRRACRLASPCSGFLSPCRCTLPAIDPLARPKRTGCRRRSPSSRITWVDRSLIGRVPPCSILRPLKRTSASITCHLSVSKRSAGSTLPAGCGRSPAWREALFFVPLPESTPINGPRSARRSCFDSISPLSFGRGLPVV